MAPKQMTLATLLDGEFETCRKTMRRDVFLAETDKVVPWLRKRVRICASKA